MPEAAFVIELGCYLVGEAGIYVSRVIDRKVSRGQVFLVTDGGLHRHLAASGNFGQVVRKNYPVTIGNRADAADREVASVVGPLCTPLDPLADRMELPVAQPGDLAVVFQSGACGATRARRGFWGTRTASRFWCGARRIAMRDAAPCSGAGARLLWAGVALLALAAGLFLAWHHPMWPVPAAGAFAAWVFVAARYPGLWLFVRSFFPPDCRCSTPRPGPAGSPSRSSTCWPSAPSPQDSGGSLFGPPYRPTRSLPDRADAAALVPSSRSGSAGSACKACAVALPTRVAGGSAGSTAMRSRSTACGWLRVCSSPWRCGRCCKTRFSTLGSGRSGAWRWACR